VIAHIDLKLFNILSCGKMMDDFRIAKSANERIFQYFSIFTILRTR